MSEPTHVREATYGLLRLFQEKYKDQYVLPHGGIVGLDKGFSPHLQKVWAFFQQMIWKIWPNALMMWPGPTNPYSYLNDGTASTGISYAHVLVRFGPLRAVTLMLIKNHFSVFFSQAVLVALAAFPSEILNILVFPIVEQQVEIRLQERVEDFVRQSPWINNKVVKAAGRMAGGLANRIVNRVAKTIGVDRSQFAHKYGMLDNQGENDGNDGKSVTKTDGTKTDDEAPDGTGVPALDPKGKPIPPPRDGKRKALLRKIVNFLNYVQEVLKINFIDDIILNLEFISLSLVGTLLLAWDFVANFLVHYLLLKNIDGVECVRNICLAVAGVSGAGGTWFAARMIRHLQALLADTVHNPPNKNIEGGHGNAGKTEGPGNVDGLLRPAFLPPAALNESTDKIQKYSEARSTGSKSRSKDKRTKLEPPRFTTDTESANEGDVERGAPLKATSKGATKDTSKGTNSGAQKVDAVNAYYVTQDNSNQPLKQVDKKNDKNNTKNAHGVASDSVDEIVRIDVVQPTSPTDKEDSNSGSGDNGEGSGNNVDGDGNTDDANSFTTGGQGFTAFTSAAKEGKPTQETELGDSESPIEMKQGQPPPVKTVEFRPTASIEPLLPSQNDLKYFSGLKWLVSRLRGTAAADRKKRPSGSFSSLDDLTTIETSSHSSEENANIDIQKYVWVPRPLTLARLHEMALTLGSATAGFLLAVEFARFMFDLLMGNDKERRLWHYYRLLGISSDNVSMLDVMSQYLDYVGFSSTEKITRKGLISVASSNLLAFVQASVALEYILRARGFDIVKK